MMPSIIVGDVVKVTEPDADWTQGQQFLNMTGGVSRVGSGSRARYSEDDISVPSISATEFLRREVEYIE
jgi:hypothetical protein